MRGRKQEGGYRELQFGVNKVRTAKQPGDEAEATLYHVEEPIAIDLSKDSLNRDGGNRRGDHFCLGRP